MQRTKLLFPSAVWPLILWLLFAGCYAIAFFLSREAFIEEYQYTVSRIPSVMLYGSSTATLLQHYGSTYGGFVGAALGLGYALVAYLFLGIAALCHLTKLKFGAMLAFLCAILPIDMLAYIIQGQPRPRTAISSALVHFVGTPLWDAAMFLTIVIVLLFILSFVYGTSSASEKHV